MGVNKVKSLIESSKFQEAIQYIDEIKENYDPDHPDYFDLMLKKGKLLDKVGEHEKCERLAHTLIDTARRQNNLVSKVDAIILLADTYWKIGKLDQTILMIEMGEIDFTKLADQLNEEDKVIKYAQLKRLKGIYYRFNNEVDLALEYFNESLVEAEKTSNKEIIGDINNLIGVCYHELGNLSSAWNYYVKSHTLRNECNDSIGQAITLFNLGSIQEHIGEFRSALTNYKQSLEISETYGNSRIKAMALSKIASIQHKFGEVETAFVNLRKSLSIHEDIGNDMYTSWTMFRLMLLLLDTDKDDLIPIYQDGMEELLENNSQNLLISQHARIIDALTAKQSNKTVERAKSQQIFYDILNEAIVDHELYILSMINLADLLLSELSNTADPEILEELEDLFDRLEKIISEQHSYPLLVNYLLLRARFSVLELQYQKALSILDEAMEMTEAKNMQSMMDEITEEYDSIVKKVGKMTEEDDNLAYKIAKVERSELEEEVARTIKKQKEKIDTSKFEPISVILSNEERDLVYSYDFADHKFKETQIKSFISAISNIFKETFALNGPVEQVKVGEYNLLAQELPQAYCTLILVLKGRVTYRAIQNFNQLANKIKSIPDAIEQLSKGQSVEENQETISSIIQVSL